jgi:hypothetical protein
MVTNVRSGAPLRNRTEVPLSSRDAGRRDPSSEDGESPRPPSTTSVRDPKIASSHRVGPTFAPSGSPRRVQRNDRRTGTSVASAPRPSSMRPGTFRARRAPRMGRFECVGHPRAVPHRTTRRSVISPAPSGPVTSQAETRITIDPSGWLPPSHDSPKGAMGLHYPVGLIPRRGIPNPLRSAFAVSHDLGGLPLSRSVRHVSSGHAPGVCFPVEIVLRRAHNHSDPRAVAIVGPETSARAAGATTTEAIVRSPLLPASRECCSFFRDGHVPPLNLALCQALSRLTRSNAPAPDETSVSEPGGWMVPSSRDRGRGCQAPSYRTSRWSRPRPAPRCGAPRGSAASLASRRNLRVTEG